jgi:hypothetical protein
MPALALPYPMLGMDYVACAVFDLLRSDPLIQLDTKGRIYRRNGFAGAGELAYPTLLVCCQAVTEEGRPGRLIKADPRIGILYCFSQFTWELVDFEPSVASALGYILSVIPAQVVNDHIFSLFPAISGSKQLAVTGEFVPIHPIPLADKNSEVAFAVGVEIKYSQWLQYPSRLPA